MSTKATAHGTRRIETELLLDAPVERVWQALVESEHLARWYPTEARVTPGVGGSVWMSFGPGMEGVERIEIWEPQKHLRTIQPRMELPVAPGGANVAFGPYAVDYFLEARGGKTVLRFVHSGFGSSTWEDEWYDSFANGWPFMFAGLKLYLERHFGTPRHFVSIRRGIAIPVEDAWGRLMSQDGLLGDTPAVSLRAGQRYALGPGGCSPIIGMVQRNDPACFRATVEGMNDALLGVAIEKCLGPVQVYVALSTFGVSEAKTDEFRRSWEALLAKLFPEEDATKPAWEGSTS